MVSILPGARTPWDLIGERTGTNLANVLPGAVQQGFQRQQGLNAIDKLQSDLAAAGGDMTKVLPAIARAISLNPSLERSGLPQYALEVAKAKASQNAPIAGEQQNREPLPPIPQRGAAPTFLNQPEQQTEQFFPSNIGPQGGPGNVPQAATSGVKQRLLTRDEKIPAAKKLAQEQSAAGIPTTVSQALDQINIAEQEKKDYNDQIDKELEQRVKGQQTYGQRAVKYLTGVYPEADPETQAIFQKIGEEESRKGGSEADINRFLAKKADQFKSAITNLEKDVSAPRLHNSILRGLEGTYKNFEQAGADARKHLQPMLDLGLYDKARNILAEKGYGPEEREIIVNPLSERSKSIINQVPDYKKTQTGKGRFGVTTNKVPPSKDALKSALVEMKQHDPNFSLVLARKAFEDKGYDWRIFKDVLNELESEGFKLEDDQERQRGYLDEPPFNKLYQALQGLNLIGR